MRNMLKWFLNFLCDVYTKDGEGMFLILNIKLNLDLQCSCKIIFEKAMKQLEVDFLELQLTRVCFKQFHQL